MDAATLTATVSSSIFIAASAAGAVRWYVKHHSIESVKDYLSELKPNGGHSLSDAVKLNILPVMRELKEDIKEVKVDIKELREENLQLAKDVSRLEGRMQAHIEDPRQ